MALLHVYFLLNYLILCENNPLLFDTFNHLLHVVQLLFQNFTPCLCRLQL